MKLNKKVYTFGIMGLFALAMISAGLVSYLSNTSTIQGEVSSPFAVGEFDGSLDAYGGNSADVSVLFENLGKNDLAGRLELTIKNYGISEYDFDSIIAEFKNSDRAGQSAWTTGQIDLLTDTTLIESVLVSDENGDGVDETMVITTKDQIWSGETEWEADATFNFNVASLGTYKVSVKVIPESSHPVYP